MQDGASPHTAKEIVWALHGGFGELNADSRIIGKSLWLLDPPI
jgi:hypothetical protein